MVTDKKWTRVPAGKLDADAIGWAITYEQFNGEGEVRTLVTAELRQICHYGDHTVIYVGIGAGVEGHLDHGMSVYLSPVPEIILPEIQEVV